MRDSSPRSGHGAVPIVVVTGETRGAELEQVRRIGADGVIVKPTTPDVLLSAVRRLLSVAQTSDETIANAPGRLQAHVAREAPSAVRHDAAARGAAVAGVPILRSAAGVRAEPHRRCQLQASRTMGRFRLSVMRQVRIPAPHAEVATCSMSKKRIRPPAAECALWYSGPAATSFKLMNPMAASIFDRQKISPCLSPRRRFRL